MKKEKAFGLPVKYVALAAVTLTAIVIGKDLFTFYKEVLFYIFSNEIVQYAGIFILGFLSIVGTIIVGILLIIGGLLLIFFIYYLMYCGLVELIAQFIKDVNHKL